MTTQTFLQLPPTLSMGLTGMEMMWELPRIPLSVLLCVNFVDRGGVGGFEMNFQTKLAYGIREAPIWTDSASFRYLSVGLNLNILDLFSHLNAGYFGIARSKLFKM